MEEIELKKNKMKLVFDCYLGPCPIGSDPDFDCGAICDRCDLYTASGEKVKTVKYKETGEVFEVSVNGDEFIFVSENGRNIFSTDSDVDKLNKIFEAEKTEAGYDPDDYFYDDYLNDDDDDNNEYTCNYVLSWYDEDE